MNHERCGGQIRLGATERKGARCHNGIERPFTRRQAFVLYEQALHEPILLAACLARHTPAGVFPEVSPKPFAQTRDTAANGQYGLSDKASPCIKRRQYCLIRPQTKRWRSTARPCRAAGSRRFCPGQACAPGGGQPPRSCRSRRRRAAPLRAQARGTFPALLRR